MSTCLLFFFKQKTAYEMRISDWSSDVCSSDLRRILQHLTGQRVDRLDQPTRARRGLIKIEHRADAQDEAARRGEIIFGLEARLAVGNVDADVADADVAEGEAARIEIGIEQIGRAHV